MYGLFFGADAAAPDSTDVADPVAVMRRFPVTISGKVFARHGAIAGLEEHISFYQNESCIAAVSGQARFVDVLLNEEADRQGIAATLVHVMAREGIQALRLLSGSFALAVLDGSSGEATLAIDRMGIRPLFYRAAGGRLVFGSRLDAIRALANEPLQIRSQAIYDYLHFHMVPGPGSIYDGCRRLLPGEYVSFRNGRLETGRYWTMRYAENVRRPFDEEKEEFLTVLRDSVRRSCDGGGKVGAFLSGGTDSSTIAGLLGVVSGEPANTYSIGFDAPGYDESEYARIAVRHFGTRHHEYYVTPDDVVQAAPRIAQVHDQPFGNSSAVPSYYCAKLAKEDGIDRVLGGDGGDELFGGNDRYAKQYLYSLYSDLPAVFRKLMIEPLAMAVSFESGIIGKVQRYMKNATVPMPARYDNYNLLERLGPESVFSQEFLDSVDRRLPAAQMAALYESVEARSLVNRMLALDLRYTLADNDLPKVVRSCELAGIPVRFPMLDDSVVAFSAKLHPDLKLRRTKLRYFFKEALRGFLPDEIITKTKHGFGLPFGMWMRNHAALRQLVMDNLAALRQRAFIRREFIDELMGARIAEHAEYYGTMAWLLMMLELWLRENDAGAQRLGWQVGGYH
jgi:asparagine synthase (glutamine-hydrolysing)